MSMEQLNHCVDTAFAVFFLFSSGWFAAGFLVGFFYKQYRKFSFSSASMPVIVPQDADIKSDVKSEDQADPLFSFVESTAIVPIAPVASPVTSTLLPDEPTESSLIISNSNNSIEAFEFTSRTDDNAELPVMSQGDWHESSLSLLDIPEDQPVSPTIALPALPASSDSEPAKSAPTKSFSSAKKSVKDKAKSHDRPKSTAKTANKNAKTATATIKVNFDDKSEDTYPAPKRKKYNAATLKSMCKARGIKTSIKEDGKTCNLRVDEMKALLIEAGAELD